MSSVLNREETKEILDMFFLLPFSVIGFFCVELAIGATIAHVPHLVIICKKCQKGEVGLGNASARPPLLSSSPRALTQEANVGDPSPWGCGLCARGTVIHLVDLTAWYNLCS